MIGSRAVVDCLKDDEAIICLYILCLYIFTRRVEILMSTYLMGRSYSMPADNTIPSPGPPLGLGRRINLLPTERTSSHPTSARSVSLLLSRATPS